MASGTLSSVGAILVSRSVQLRTYTVVKIRLFLRPSPVFFWQDCELLGPIFSVESVV